MLGDGEKDWLGTGGIGDEEPELAELLVDAELVAAETKIEQQIGDAAEKVGEDEAGESLST